MQDEINEKIVALSIRAGTNTGRVTSSVLKAAIRKYLQAHAQRKAQRAEEKALLEEVELFPCGKQTVSQLMNQEEKLTNIEITNRNIKSFERVANKYSIDFALKRDWSARPPHYLVFFKARDMDVMKAAFQEFSAKELNKTKRPSILKKLAHFRQKTQTQQKQREKVKTRERGQER
jgi:hypothetical protein